MTKRDKLMQEVGIDDTLFDPYNETFAKNRWKYAQSPPDYVDWFTPYRRLSKRQHFFNTIPKFFLANSMQRVYNIHKS